MTPPDERFQFVVLVVDDDAFERKLIDQILAEELFELIFACSGVEALALLGQTQPDLILMDLCMPGVSGLEALRRIKAAPRFAAIPVMMLTGQGDKGVVVECFKAGAADFLVKPLDREVFRKKVARCLEHQA